MVVSMLLRSCMITSLYLQKYRICFARSRHEAVLHYDHWVYCSKFLLDDLTNLPTMPQFKTRVKNTFLLALGQTTFIAKYFMYNGTFRVKEK